MRVKVSLRYLTMLRNFLNGMMMDMCITNGNFDNIQQIIGGLNMILANPENYGLEK